MCSARSAARASMARISSPRRSQRGAVAVVARPEARVEGARAHRRRRAAPGVRRARGADSYAPYPDTIVAVTGTNGKTSTVEMTRQLWRMAGHRSASIGTLGVTTADDQVKTGLTTPRHRHLPQQHGGHASGWGSAMSPTKPRRTGSTSIAPRACRCSAAAFTNLQPRPPRLSCRHGRLFRGQDAAVRRGRRRRRRRRWCGPAIRKSAEVIDARHGARPEADHRRRSGRDDPAGRAARRPRSARRSCCATTGRSIS